MVFRLVFLCLVCATVGVHAETLRHPATLEQQLKSSDARYLAREVRLRGDARRGALVFYKSAAACAICHLSGESASPLGPDLAKLGQVSDEHVVESLLHPSKSIRKGYETQSVLTIDGQVWVGMIVRQDDKSMVLRVASDLNQDKVIPLENVEAVKRHDKSMMPEGLMTSLEELRDFYDLAKYIIEVAAGGPEAATALKPSAQQLAVRDDTKDLDHAGIISKLRDRDFQTGKSIYHGYCFNCHGSDGNTPSLPTARAFGSDRLKFGSDPHRMFLTLSRGNGLMGPMTHLTPKERYQVVHYVREAFMKPANPDYFQVNADYLSGLPRGTEDGTSVVQVDRDYGPALGSQLRRDYSSVLTVRLDDAAIAYDLHTMNQAAIWRGGFLDLSDTQHARDRGEGTAMPQGDEIAPLATWQWGHDGSLDYPRENLLPRGPLPKRWTDYHGHYLSGEKVVLSYAIDGREILEHPYSANGAIVHAIEIGPGEPLVLAVAEASGANRTVRFGKGFGGGIGFFPASERRQDVSVAVALAASSKENELEDFAIFRVLGDHQSMQWSVDSRKRLLLHIPADQKRRTIQVFRIEGHGDEAANRKVRAFRHVARSPRDFIGGGPPNWPSELQTTGTLGLEQGAYALDTLTLPDSTPWNTWFRTSALDFFPDGRMVVTTYGGDVWIVSGIDNELLNIRWKRFAAGLYEPFGVKVVDGDVYVTCKDRLTRLHDRDGNGEADFYESFSADTDVSVNFHAFNFDLQTDSEGNFYYAKSGHGGDSEIPGAVIKISPDGEQRELFCTGFRTPNGMGMLPDGRPTASDNQGQWTPASKISLLREGGFYGWVNNYSVPGKWSPGGGTIDLEKVVPPTTFDPPLVWMPQEFDNSSGGQLWADDPRWGPLSGRLLHTSFGKGWMSYAMIQEVGDVAQAAIIKLPFDFRTGIMRARVNPADGQVYATGLQGWNGNGRFGLQAGGVQRLRYRGKNLPMVTDCRVESDGLRIDFNFPLDPDSASDLGSYIAHHWNYHWRSDYGSDMYSPTTDEPGVEKINIESASLGSDGASVKLNIPGLKPVNQVHLIVNVKSRNGDSFEEEIYWTINRVP